MGNNVRIGKKEFEGKILNEWQNWKTNRFESRYLLRIFKKMPDFYKEFLTCLENFYPRKRAATFFDASPQLTLWTRQTLSITWKFQKWNFDFEEVDFQWKWHGRGENGAICYNIISISPSTWRKSIVTASTHVHTHTHSCTDDTRVACALNAPNSLYVDRKIDMAILQKRIYVIVRARLPWHKFSTRKIYLHVSIHRSRSHTWTFTDRNECPCHFSLRMWRWRNFNIIYFQLNDFEKFVVNAARKKKHRV